MTHLESYPVIRTEHFAKTVAFYEDLFGFVPCYEVDGFVRLKQKDTGSVMMSIVDMNHEFLPKGLLNGQQGQIMSFIVDEFEDCYDQMYMEGLKIVKEPQWYSTGGKHFMVADPYNSVVINIVRPIEETETGCTENSNKQVSE